MNGATKAWGWAPGWTSIRASIRTAGGRLFVGLLAAAQLAGCARYDDFAAYEQLLPRGQIAAIVAPEFVAAGEAEIADESWVLGVVIDGQPRAYSLNLLNAHEVVNDRIGETAFAAVW